MSKDDQTPIDKAKELVNDAKDVAKIAADVATGNVVGVATTALKNKRLRKIIIWAIIISLAGQMIGFLLMMTLIIGASDMFQFPMMSFSTNQTIVETQPNGQKVTVNFLTLSNQWAKTIRWGFMGENKGLTQAEISQVNQLQLNLSYGLLETFYEIGIRQGAINPLKKMSYVVQQLQPSEIDFKPVTLRKVGYTSKGKKYFYYVTEQVLQNITRYNGYWITHWQIITESDGSQIVVFQPSTLQNKNYKPLYNSEQAFNVHQDTLEQQEFFGQALVLDKNFYDPNALPILQMLEGGGDPGSGNGAFGDTSGTPPTSGYPLPSTQLIADLTQALQIDHEPLSWLPALEYMAYKESSDNPDAIYHDPETGIIPSNPPSGLLQVKPRTFWPNSLPGYQDIWNPLDNAIASINHIKGYWGGIQNIPGVPGGAPGPYKGY